MTLVETTHVKIDAPDAGAAFKLEQRLAHLHASAVERHGAWSVELEPTIDRLDEIAAAIRRWLHEIERRSTVVSTGGRAHTLTADADESPLGADYDGRALDHEP